MPPIGTIYDIFVLDHFLNLQLGTLQDGAYPHLVCQPIYQENTEISKWDIHINTRIYQLLETTQKKHYLDIMKQFYVHFKALI